MNDETPLKKGPNANDLARINRLKKEREENAEPDSGSGAGEVGAKIEELQQRMSELEEKVAKCCNKSASRRKSESLLTKDALYVVVLGVVIIAVLLLVAYGWAQKPTVAINFDVGNIIGGVLVGMAALIAGLTYARREKDTDKVPPQDQEKD